MFSNELTQLTTLCVFRGTGTSHFVFCINIYFSHYKKFKHKKIVHYYLCLLSSDSQTTACYSKEHHQSATFSNVGGPTARATTTSPATIPTASLKTATILRNKKATPSNTNKKLSRFELAQHRKSLSENDLLHEIDSALVLSRGFLYARGMLCTFKSHAQLLTHDNKNNNLIYVYVPLNPSLHFFTLSVCFVFVICLYILFCVRPFFLAMFLETFCANSNMIRHMSALFLQNRVKYTTILFIHSATQNLNGF